ncbi:MAG TPA: BadF/BadG/BcrA/BcrD ATPase family protein [Bryobacteraceae bacterium]|nr:BadF/BadG/BcrA/BcrD ATPase family protein [Bryobacteraceae bacterium]
MGFYLGIDGGQSSTTAMIGDAAGRVIGFGSGGPCNHVRAAEGRTKFLKAIGACVNAACAEAGVNAAEIRFECVCAGFSGGPADKRELLGELLQPKRIEVTDDAVIALAGANAGEPAVVTIAGTGSISLGRNRQGRLARAGGWGYLFGDEGGGFDITRQALRAALRHEEGWGPETRLRDTLLGETGCADVNDLMHRMYTTEFPRPRIAAMARLVDDAAMAGDVIARSILLNAAQELATYTAAVRVQIFEAGEPVFVACIGGVFRSALLLERFRMLVELEEGSSVGRPRYGPAAGALIEAYRAAGLNVDITGVPEREK